MTFGAWGPLLAIRAAGERRTVAIHYEVLSPRASARAVQRPRFRAGTVRDVKASSRGFAATANRTSAAPAATAYSWSRAPTLDR